MANVLCSTNSTLSREIVQSLNPGVGFEVGDVDRLPIFPSAWADEILATVLRESKARINVRRGKETRVRRPGASPWRHVQEWAQTAVDQPEGAPLPPYDPEDDHEPPINNLSFALGVTLGRFGPNGEGILDPTRDDLSHALPAGILSLDGTLDREDNRDGLGEVAAAPLREAWEKYGPAIETNRTSLREWLALEFFKGVHKGMYQNRPIYWPLSSPQKTFVAWVNMHRFTAQTLRILLADHLNPTLSRLDGELNDLRAARVGADRKAARKAEKRYDRVLKGKEELEAFIVGVEQCADKGAPPTDAELSNTPGGCTIRSGP